MDIQKRSRWRSEKSVRRYDKHARLLKETSKLSDVTRKYGQMVMSHMSRLLSGTLPLPPPVLTRLVRNLAKLQGIFPFGFPIRKRFTLFSVNVPVHLKLARRCENFGNVCSFSGKAHRQLGSCFERSFPPSSSSSLICCLCCSCTCSLVSCQRQLDKQATLVGLNHGQVHR